MTTGLVGSIPFQEEIYVATEMRGYVSIKTEVGEEYEQCIHIRASDVDALIGLLVAAKREALEAKD